MTVTGNDPRDDDARAGQQPPVFPRVGGQFSADDETRLHQPVDPLFSGPPGDRAPDEPPLQPAPVTPVPAQARRRWMLALVATIAVVAVVGGLFLLTGPRPGTPSTAARYAPADTIAYAEIRLDLPGDQRERLASFMSHFPGFADPASFDQKIDDMLNEMLASTGQDLDWLTDVEPWFGGQLAVLSTTVTPSPGTPPSFTAVMTVRDRAALEQVMAEKGVTSNATEEDYQGQPIWTSSLSADGQRVTFAVTDEVLLVGLRVEDVRDALDVRADREPGLADDQFFLTQLAALHADQLATVYFDGRSTTNSIGSQFGESMPGLESLDWLMNAKAMRVIGELRAEGDHLAMISRTERSATADLPPLPANRNTDLAAMAPANSLAYAEFRDVGQSLGFAIERLLEPLASAEDGMVAPNMFNELLGTPPEDFLDFVGDVSVSVAYENETVEAGLVATVDDEVIARQRLERVLTAIRSVAAFVGGLTVEEETHGDSTITVISVGAMLGDAAGESVSLTVSGGHLLIGVDDFVVNALDRESGQSLATRPEYQAALAAGGASNAGVMYADIAALRELAEGYMPVAERAPYDQELRPYVEPLSHLAVISTTDGSTTVSHLLVYVE